MKNKHTEWQISPSDLTFLWDECKRCFYLKVVEGIARPSTPMPKIFTILDILSKNYFSGKSVSEISPDLPDGTVVFGEKWVASNTITLPGHESSFYFRGKFDSLIKFADSSYGVIDFKTSKPKPEHVSFYSRQLHAYAYALENHAPRSLSLKPVSKLGLLYIEPVSLENVGQDQTAYMVNVTWQECPKDDLAFLDFLSDVLTVLESPTPPAASPNCKFCQYSETIKHYQTPSFTPALQDCKVFPACGTY